MWIKHYIIQVIVAIGVTIFIGTAFYGIQSKQAAQTKFRLTCENANGLAVATEHNDYVCLKRDSVILIDNIRD
jgi:hypothetical protein